MKRSDKRASHVGMILSFVIFITFVFFLYFVFEPSLKTSDEKKLILSSIESKLLNEFQEDFMQVIVTNKSLIIAGDCLKIQNSNIFPNTFLIVVKDSENNFVEYNSSSTNTIYVNWTDGIKFLRVYGANNLTERENSVDISSCIKEGKIESIDIQKYASLGKIRDSSNEYNSNYDIFKNNLKIPTEYEFEFQFKDAEDNWYNATRPVRPSKIDIYARKLSVAYFDKDANILIGDLYVRTW